MTQSPFDLLQRYSFMVILHVLPAGFALSDSVPPPSSQEPQRTIANHLNQESCWCGFHDHLDVEMLWNLHISKSTYVNL